MIHMILSWLARGSIYDAIYKAEHHASLSASIAVAVVAIVIFAAWSRFGRRRRWRR